MVNLLLNRGADPQVTNESLRTPLHYAVEKGFAGVCRKLLDSGDWPVKLTRDIDGNTPLTLALRRGNDEIASLIITYMYHSEWVNYVFPFGWHLVVVGCLQVCIDDFTSYAIWTFHVPVGVTQVR